jgi:hypothetical protein
MKNPVVPGDFEATDIAMFLCQVPHPAARYAIITRTALKTNLFISILC